MRDQDKVSIAEAMAELAALEDRADREEALRIAVAQMVAGAVFLEARAGKGRADRVVAELYRAQVGVRS